MSGYVDYNDDKIISVDTMKPISIRLPPVLIDELKGYCESKPYGYQTLIRNVLQDYVVAKKHDELRELTIENHELRKSINEQKEISMLEKNYTQQLHKHINETHETISFEFGRHTITFATEPNAVIYHIFLDGSKVKTQPVNLSLSKFGLSEMLSNDMLCTCSEDGNNVSDTHIGPIQISMALIDLTSNPVNFVQDERYVSLVKHLKRLDEPFIIENDDVITTIEYTNMFVCVTTVIEGEFRRRNWFGRNTKPVDIAVKIHEHFEQINVPARLQNLVFLKEMLHDLSGYFLSE